MRKWFIVFPFIISFVLNAYNLPLHQYDNVILKKITSEHYENTKNALDQFNIQYEEVDSISETDERLYVLFDTQDLMEQSLPNNFIVYQTLDLKVSPLTEAYIKKLNKAAVVWDYSLDNIGKYKSKIHHYYYFPKDYEFTDPVILSCYLPVTTLTKYKEILAYSNIHLTDICSHLPTMFVFSYMKEKSSQLLLELGIRSGESSYALYSAAKLCNTNIIGVDLDPACSSVYAKYKDPTLKFFAISDISFPSFFYKNNQTNLNADIIFIDTSHLYEHTLQELKVFTPILNKYGMFLFHDTNLGPFKWDYINGGQNGPGWDNQGGVVKPIKQFFDISFDESKYCNFTFTKEDKTWQIVHYPFCNGFTLLAIID